MKLRAASFMVAALLGLLPAGFGRAAQPVDFNRDIRPILSKNCFPCHGPDSGHRVSKLRLDESESALRKQKDGRAAIVPGQPDRSELLWRVRSPEAARRMPPPERGAALK